MKISHQKLKLLYLMKILLDQTDEEHTMTVPQMINVDKIHEAIAADRQITFKYFDINVDKKKVYRKNGERYTESPISLTWDDENYYLITYKDKYGKYVHYRVDKMEKIELTDNNREMPEKTFDLSQYAKSMFQMFNGEETEVSIQFENELVGVVYDRFGIDVPIIKSDEAHFICRVKVAVSPHFLSWIIAFGSRAKIIAPDTVIEQICELLHSAYDNYKD